MSSGLHQDSNLCRPRPLRLAIKKKPALPIAQLRTQKKEFHGRMLNLIFLNDPSKGVRIHSDIYIDYLDHTIPKLGGTCILHFIIEFKI